MAWPSRPDLHRWGGSGLAIPPRSAHAWLQLATWELWMGALVCMSLGFGIFLLATTGDRIIIVSDLSACYAPPPVARPCEILVYRGGLLNAVFTGLVGLMLVGVAAWSLWELWNVTESRPIADDFLRLLHDSFGRDWRNPFTWPWMRMLWAYGFTAVGAALTAGVGMLIWTMVASSHPDKEPTAHIDTSQTFRLGQ